MYASTDFGVHWTEISSGLPGADSREAVSIATDPVDPNTIYVSFRDRGIFRSTNRGQTWTSVGQAGSALVGKLAIDPTNRSRLLAATNGGLHISQDNGSTWAMVNVPVSSYGWVGFDRSNPTRVLACGGDTFCVTSGDIASGNWQLTQSFFIGWLGDVSFDGGRVLVGSSTGAKYSPDTGATFVDVNQGIFTSYASRLSAALDGTIYAGFYNGLAGVYRWEAGNWAAPDIFEMFMLLGRTSDTGLVPNITSVSVAPTDSSIVYATGSQGILRSSDKGTHWSKPSTQFDSVEMTRVLADPKNPQVAYVSTLQTGLWRTADGGASWERRSTGLPDSMDVMAIDPTNTNILYAGGGDPLSALYKSTDAGLHWMAAGPAGLRVASLAIDPVTPAVLYAARSVGLYRSADAGATWQQLGVIGSFSEVLADPEIPGLLTAVGVSETASVLRSVDSGKSWEALLPGPLAPPLRPHFGVLDPLRPSRILTTTERDGLWELEVAPDLQVSIDQLPEILTRGTTVSAIVHVTNAGPYSASDVNLAVMLPDWLTAPSPPQGCSVAGSRLQCSIGAIRKGEAPVRTIQLTVADIVGSGMLSASVQGHEADPDPSNNAASIVVATGAASTGSPPSGTAPSGAQPAGTPPTQTSSSAQGAGGGGYFDWLGLLALLICGTQRGAIRSFRSRPRATLAYRSPATDDGGHESSPFAVRAGRCAIGCRAGDGAGYRRLDPH